MGATPPAIPPESPAHRPASALVPWAMALVAAVWVLAATNPARSLGDTLFSRLATVYALAHEGTFTLGVAGQPESNPFVGRTVDKVRIDDRTVSSKPPVLPLLMTAEYRVLRVITGWSLDDSDDVLNITRLLTYTFCGVPFIVLVWCLTRSAQWIAPGTAPAVFIGFAAIAGTQAGAFATVFNNHVPAASAVIVSFWIALRLMSNPTAANPWNYIAFGLAAGFAATIDTPAALFPALFGLALAPRHLKPLLVWGVPAALLIVATQSIALIISTGSPLPVQLRPEVYLFENSEWRNPLGVDALNDPPGLYLFHITIGRVGIFSLFPVTLLAIPGFIVWWRSVAATRWVAACAVIAGLVIAAYYVKTTNNYGGSAFGFRWFIVLGPVLLLLATPALGRLKRTWHWIAPLALLAASMFPTLEAVRKPWSSNEEWTVRIFGPSV